VEYALFPRQHEGNNYSVNFSLVEDGVCAAGDDTNAFRNARIPVLTTRFSAKVEGGKVELKEPKYIGKYSVLEAGDSVSHDDFLEASSAQNMYLSSGVDLYVEDASLGSFAPSRVGVRVVTDSPAKALIARTLLMPIPNRNVDHRARFNGWNYDERWIVKESVWNGTDYDLIEYPTSSLPGQRPIVANYGGPGDAIAIQFIERQSVIVGANIMAGGGAPIRGVIDALEQATGVLLNVQLEDSITVPSVSISKGKETVVIIGGDDAVVNAALAKNVLYGPYSNTLSTLGVSSLFNGVIGSIPKGGLPAVVVDGKVAISHEPNNLAFAATEIVFYKAGAKAAKLTEEEAVQRLVDLTDDSKVEIAKLIVKGVKLSVVGSIDGLKI
jgi:hypothetical protein